VDYYGQVKQDQFINEFIFKGKKTGFFVEIGANNGITFSNSYFFEKLGWNGICIEPAPDTFRELVKNRKCTCLQLAVSITEGQLDFCVVEGSSVLNGLIDNYDSKQVERIKRESESTKIIKVATRTAESIFDEHNVKHIDFCSIDTEGAELDVLKSINFNKITIDCFVIENNHSNNEIADFMNNIGYKKVATISGDEFYIHSKNKYKVNIFQVLLHKIRIKL
jgi:FkbM family methyltransferase